MRTGDAGGGNSIIFLLAAQVALDKSKARVDYCCHSIVSSSPYLRRR